MKGSDACTSPPSETLHLKELGVQEMLDLAETSYIETAHICRVGACLEKASQKRVRRSTVRGAGSRYHISAPADGSDLVEPAVSSTITRLPGAENTLCHGFKPHESFLEWVSACRRARFCILDITISLPSVLGERIQLN